MRIVHELAHIDLNQIVPLQKVLYYNKVVNVISIVLESCLIF